MLTETELLTTNEAAKMLRCSPYRVRELVKDGRLPARRLPGSRSRLLFNRSELLSALQHAGKVPAEGGAA